MSRVFSGVQPTGNLHLGNYLGAIRNFVRLQDKFECIFCIVDLHAITVWQDPDLLRNQTREIAAAFIASGIDPISNIVFNQSQVPAHAELAWVFNCVARIGWLNRMTQFKEKAGKHKENASVGLYVYPDLMAADILAYKATHVPVGDDQKQHLELTRDIAQKFNSDFGVDFFPLTEPLIFGAATRVMSLRDGRQKMSKSAESEMSRINMTDTADDIARKIQKAKTDPDPLPGPDALTDDGKPSRDLESARPEAVNLMSIFAALSDREISDIAAEFEGRQFSSFKKSLTDLAVATLDPIATEMRRLTGDAAQLDAIIHDGCERANQISAPILREIHDIVGFLRTT
jgi:tryptophanyl-tRNA synthetase